MILIKNGKVHLGNGKILENTDILIKDGKICKVESDIDEKDVDIIDAKGKEVFPGFIDSITHWGCLGSTFTDMDYEEKTDPVTPQMNIIYAFDAENCTIQELYKAGITTVGVSPSDSNVIAGQIAAFKTYGDSPYEMLVRETVALKGSVTSTVKKTYGDQNKAPKTRMGISSILKNALEEAKKYDPSKEDVAKDEGKAILKKVLNKELPLIVSANTKAEIDGVINLFKDYDIDLTICNAFMAGKSKDSIIASNISLILGEQVNMQDHNDEIDLDKIIDIHEAGVNVSLSTACDMGAGGQEGLLWNAINVYKAGLDSEEVLKMITINPAKVLKIDDKVGTIEVGKDADVVIYTNNPIECFDSSITHSIIKGKIVYCKGECV